MVASKVQSNGSTPTSFVVNNSITLSRDSAELLLSILGQTSLGVGGSDFETFAPLCIKAKRELVEALGIESDTL